MSSMFGDRLFEFVLSIDFLDEEVFFEFLELIANYVDKHLDVTYFSVLEEDEVGGTKALQTLWSTRDERPRSMLESGEGKKRQYTSHSAYTFGENKPVWAVSATREPLQSSSRIEDLWSHSKDLPLYKPIREEQVCTSVMHPLRHEGRAIGVVEFASEKYVEPATASKQEAATLATVISRAYRIYDVGKAHRSNTKQAIKKLAESLEKGSWARLALPQLFVAFPDGAGLPDEIRDRHALVIETIKNVVNEFSTTLTPLFWDEVTESGDINEQVIRDIGCSDYGLCYFSKPTDSGYEDSDNVLFEAGMMQALRHSSVAPFSGWIPIRERDNREIPFDIKSERTVYVDRNDGVLDKEKFADSLRASLHDLVKESGAPDRPNGDTLAQRITSLVRPRRR